MIQTVLPLNDWFEPLDNHGGWSISIQTLLFVL